MSQVKYKVPISGAKGTVGKTDASKGRDPGIGATLSWTDKPYEYYVKKFAPRKRSPLQKARSDRYCYCDQKWEEMSSQRMLHLRPWWMQVHNLKSWTLPSYQTWMHGCLKGLEEMDLFGVFCWVGRYRLVNMTGAVLPAQSISLLDVPYLDPAGTDNEVHVLLPNGFLGGNVPRVVVEPGLLDILIPDMQPGDALAWDVYAYVDV